MGEARGREGLLFGALARRNCPALRHATADRLLRGFRGDRQCSRHRRSIQRAAGANLTPNHVIGFWPKVVAPETACGLPVHEQAGSVTPVLRFAEATSRGRVWGALWVRAVGR